MMKTFTKLELAYILKVANLLEFYPELEICLLLEQLKQELKQETTKLSKLYKALSKTQESFNKRVEELYSNI